MLLGVEWAPRPRSFHNFGRSILLHNFLLSDGQTRFT